MKLTYDLKLTDLINFYIHMTKLSEPNRRRIRKKKWSLFFIVLCFSLFLQWWFVKPDKSVYYTISLLVALLPVFLYSLYEENSIKKKFKKFHKNSREPNLFGTYQVSLEKEGLKVLVVGGQAEFYPWKNIQNIVKRKSYIYIYTDAIHAVIIPVRVFYTIDDCHFFLNELKRHIKDSTNQSIKVDDR